MDQHRIRRSRSSNPLHARLHRTDPAAFPIATGALGLDCGRKRPTQGSSTWPSPRSTRRRSRALHEAEDAFVVANVWDGGSARMMAALGFPFTLTGRTENFLRGRTDLDDTIKRLHAYEAAGADALMAPGLPDLESVRAVCAATTKPFNFMVGIKGKSFTVAALAEAGVKRISLATSLYRAAMTGLHS